MPGRFSEFRTTLSTLQLVLILVGMLVLIPVLLILIPLLIVGFLLWVILYRGVLVLLVWLLWAPRGIDTLLITSNSPHWQEHMAFRVLPLIAKRTIVLNWSERRAWNRRSLAVRVFRSFAGVFEFNPAVIVIRPFTKPRVFRFWQAFRDLKHGNPAPLKAVEGQLFRYLNQQPPDWTNATVSVDRIESQVTG